ncbi:hypothetical protein CMI37_19005 [Candidatus Pacearchaeota archaeon]|nr:hypothetical protein [Candidatus Pacearchaeota archaeon]|tara:strand:+ start:2343 stop:2726 length:384 start_codon:yes stop_codon:yes gene_type:complete
MLLAEDPSELSEEAKEVALEAAHEAIHELQADGLSEDEAQDLLVQILDGVLAWRLFLQEPLASALEIADGPAISLALEKVLPHLKRDPDKIETRAAEAEEKGRHKVAERRRRRAARVRERLAEKAEG